MAGKFTDLPHGTETILIVDDHESIWDFLIEALQTLGYSVILAENGLDAVEIYRENPSEIDLVLLDMTLEDATDYQVISRLRKALPAATVLIVLTDSRKVEYVEKLMENGADFCFRKPVVSGDMIAFVTKLKNGGKDLL